MFAHRQVLEGGAGGMALDVAFTDRHGPGGSLDLQLSRANASTGHGSGVQSLLAALGGTGPVVGMRQVHGAEVCVVDASSSDGSFEADGLVTATPGVALLVRVADCVPVLLADRGAGVVGAAHAGRLGMLGGVVPATVDRMRQLGAESVEAWIGPHVCGACYEVPGAMQDEIADAVPASRARTSWGTPSLDLGAGVRAQLERSGVVVHDVSRCTVEDEDLWSYRRQGPEAGRLGGVVRMSASEANHE